MSYALCVCLVTACAEGEALLTDHMSSTHSLSLELHLQLSPPPPFPSPCTSHLCPRSAKKPLALSSWYRLGRVSARVRRVSRLKVLKKALWLGRMKSTLLYSLVQAGGVMGACVMGGGGKMIENCVTTAIKQENLTSHFHLTPNYINFTHLIASFPSPPFICIIPSHHLSTRGGYASASLWRHTVNLSLFLCGSRD